MKKQIRGYGFRIGLLLIFSPNLAAADQKEVHKFVNNAFGFGDAVSFKSTAAGLVVDPKSIDTKKVTKVKAVSHDIYKIAIEKPNAVGKLRELADVKPRQGIHTIAFMSGANDRMIMMAHLGDNDSTLVAVTGCVASVRRKPEDEGGLCITVNKSTCPFWHKVKSASSPEMATYFDKHAPKEDMLLIETLWPRVRMQTLQKLLYETLKRKEYKETSIYIGFSGLNAMAEGLCKANEWGWKMTSK